MADFGSPYARTLALILSREGGRAVVRMPPGDHVGGRPGFLHGGAIAGLLEYAARAALTTALAEGESIKPITITVDYLRGGRQETAYASAVIVRRGRRIANVAATAWQDDEAKPIASATLKFLISRG